MVDKDESQRPHRPGDWGKRRDAVGQLERLTSEAETRADTLFVEVHRATLRLVLDEVARSDARREHFAAELRRAYGGQAPCEELSRILLRYIDDPYITQAYHQGDEPHDPYFSAAGRPPRGE